MCKSAGGAVGYYNSLYTGEKSLGAPMLSASRSPFAHLSLSLFLFRSLYLACAERLRSLYGPEAFRSIQSAESYVFSFPSPLCALFSRSLSLSLSLSLSWPLLAPVSLSFSLSLSLLLHNFIRAPLVPSEPTYALAYIRRRSSKVTKKLTIAQSPSPDVAFKLNVITKQYSDT